MKKLEPGMLCRVEGATMKENNGKIVTLVKFVGVPPIDPMPMQYWSPAWWEIKEKIAAGSSELGTKRYIPYAKERCLVPINPDHQPADEEWQADFKRLLSVDKQTTKNGGAHENNTSIK